MSLRSVNANSRNVLGVFLLLPYFIAVTLLSAFGDGGLFESALVFSVILITSFSFSQMARMQGHEPFLWWSGAFDRGDLKYIGFGILGLLGSVFIVTAAIPGATGILIALGIGGGILAYTLIKTETILVPVFIHSIYNLVVIALAGGFFSFLGLSAFPLTSSPIFVPSFGFDLHDANNFVSQAFLQFALVSMGEEMLKVSLALGVSLFLTRNKYVMFGTAAVLWSLLHAILAYRV